jgi:hypothetical protein
MADTPPTDDPSALVSKQTRRDPAQGPPDSAVTLFAQTKGGFSRSNVTPLKAARRGRHRSMAMKLYVGRVMTAGMLVTAIAAAAQARPPQVLPSQIGPSPYVMVSDVGGPDTGMAAPDYMPPRYAPVMLLPPQEVYMIVRESGYEPLGMPRQRGVIYTVAVIDSDGEDGRLVIDARNGRILRFLPAFRMGDRMGDDFAADMPNSRPPVPLASVPLPPASIPSRQALAPMPPASVPRPLVPVPRHLANRSVGVPPPKATPPVAVAEPKPAAASLAAAPEPAAAAPQQSAAVQPKPAEAASPGVTIGQAPAKPSVRIMPTQPMPRAQGLD